MKILEDKVLSILKEIRDDIDYISELKMIDEGILESFDVMQIAVELSECFNIIIDSDDIEAENFNSFEAICNMVRRKLQ